MKDIKLFAFDLFDTTIQETVHHNPYNKIIRASWITDKEIIKQCLTKDMSIKELLHVFWVADRFSEDEIQRQLDEEYEWTRVMPGTTGVFNAIRTTTNAQIAIISNLASPYGKVIEKLPHVDHVVFSYKAGFAKPQAEIFKLLQQKVWLPSEKIVMIGNSFAHDYEGAKNVWRNAIHLDHKKDHHTDESIGSLFELIPYIIYD